MVNGIELSSVGCKRNDGSKWACEFKFPWDQMPSFSGPVLTTPYYFQALHFHYPPGDEHKNFVGSLCPGSGAAEGDVNWKGCYIDPRFFATVEGLAKSKHEPSS